MRKTMIDFKPKRPSDLDLQASEMLIGMDGQATPAEMAAGNEEVEQELPEEELEQLRLLTEAIQKQRASKEYQQKIINKNKGVKDVPK